MVVVIRVEIPCTSDANTACYVCPLYVFQLVRIDSPSPSLSSSPSSSFSPCLSALYWSILLYSTVSQEVLIPRAYKRKHCKKDVLTTECMVTLVAGDSVCEVLLAI